MVTGQIRSPFVPLANERIDRRHAHSVALAAFLRNAKTDHRGGMEHCRKFLPPRHFRRSAQVARFSTYLTPVPEELTSALRRVLPSPVQRGDRPRRQRLGRTPLEAA